MSSANNAESASIEGPDSPPAVSSEQSLTNEDRFHNFFENSPDALVLADDSGQYLEVNAVACDLFGYSREQMLQMRVGDLMTAELPDASQRYHAYVKAGCEKGEFRFLRKNKELRIASYSACLVAPGQHLSALRDITEEKRAEVQRKAEAERLSQIIAVQQEISSASGDLNQVARVLVERIQRIMGAQAISVELVEDEEIVCVASLGDIAPPAGLRLPMQDSLSGRCILENTLLKYDDLEQDDRRDREACRIMSLRSVIVFPLRHEGAAVGVLKVMSSQPHALSDDDVTTLHLMAPIMTAALSDAVSLAAEQARLAAHAQAMETIRRSEARLREAQSVAHIGSWEFEIPSKKLTWSDEMFRLLEFDPAQGVPSYCEVMKRYHPDDALMQNRLLESACENEEASQFDVRAILGDGSIRWLHAIVKSVCGENGRPSYLFGTLHDVTESKRLAHELEAANNHLEATNLLLVQQQAALLAGHQQLEALATSDGLTGLKNHRAFQEELLAEFDRSRRYHTTLSLLLIDVDHFKPFNDTFGHPNGDKVLRKVAEVLRTSARTSDIVARYGGEEFAIILPETDAKDAMEVAERVRNAIAQTNWEQRAITISIGVASLHENTHPAGLVEEADQALYQSKGAGRNQVTYFKREADQH